MYYDPKTGIKPYKQAIRDAFGDREKLNGPIGCELVFRFTRPKSHTKKQRQCGWHTGKADVDNLAKAVLDALNKIAFDDDKQIAFVTACKQWASDESESGIYISLRELQ